MAATRNQNLKYLVINATDELWGSYVTTIGYQTILPNISYPPKAHPSSYWFNPDKGRILHEYQFLYITKGEGAFQSASCKSTKLSAGSVIVLFPEEWHTYKPLKNTGWEEHWIGINGHSLDNLLTNNFFSKKNPVLDIGFNEQLLTLWNQGIEIAGFQKTAYQQKRMVEFYLSGRS